MKKNKTAAALISFFLICVLFAFGESFSSGIRNGLYACSNIIIPSLFPFMVFMNLLLRTGLSDSFIRPFYYLLRPLLLLLVNAIARRVSEISLF